MARSEKKIKMITHCNPNAMTTAEISGNDREKALELLKKLKELEKKKNKKKKKNEVKK